MIERRRLVTAAGLLLLFVLSTLLYFHASHYMPFFADDSLISLRYAQRLLSGHGLTWTDGVRVEGYSNLLWILAISSLGVFHVDLITATRFLGLSMMAGTTAAIVYTGCRRGMRALPAATVGGLTFVLSGWTAIWAIGGLETPLVALTLSWALVSGARLVEREVPRPSEVITTGALLALLAISRLDGIVFTATVAVALVLLRGVTIANLKAAVLLVVGGSSLDVCQILFRRIYYGVWIPNTALVKVAFSTARLEGGLDYVKDGAFSSWPVLILIVIALVMGLVRSSSRKRVLFFALSFAAWAVYVVLIGGDIFPGNRHLVELSAIGALLIAESPAWEWTGLRLRTVAIIGGTAWLLGTFALTHERDMQNLRGIWERWEWDGKKVSTVLRDAFPARPLLAVDPAGCMVYWTDFPAIDMLGLNDYYLPRHPPQDFGQGFLGHELGDGKYVLDQKPDLVLMCGPKGSRGEACFRSGYQMMFNSSLGFKKLYTPVTVRVTPHLSSSLWMRNESTKLGFRRSANEVQLPAFYLRGTESESGAGGALTTLVPPGHRVEMTGPQLGAGRWRVSTDPVDAPIVADVRQSIADAPSLRVAGSSAEFLVPSDGPVDISVALPAGSAEPVVLRSLTLTRIPSTD